MLEVRDLSKSFGSLKAVDGLTFSVQAGEVFGLLGPNGAGKTTTISCLCGLLSPDGGEIVLEGHDLSADPIGFKRRLGVVPQDVALYEDLNAIENLRFWGGLAGLRGSKLKERISRVLEAVELEEKAKEPVKKYSGGMKRRLNLAAGLIHQPKLLLLDEPTVGIDVQARMHILDLVRETARAGTAIVYTTHYMEEAERVCDRIGIMDHGKMLAQGTLEDLSRLSGEAHLVSLSGGFGASEFRSAIEDLEGLEVNSIADGSALLSVRGGSEGVSRVLSAVITRGIGIDEVSIREPGLQGVFVNLTGRELRD